MSAYVTFTFFFFFNDTATTEIYTLSLHDALPISCSAARRRGRGSTTSCLRYSGLGVWDRVKQLPRRTTRSSRSSRAQSRSEEHTSELQSQSNLVCRLLLEKKK